MRNQIGIYELLNRHTNEYEESHLYDAIAPNNIDDFENHWRKAFDKKIAEVGKDGDYAEANIQDQHWLWREKTAKRANRLDYQSFAIEADGITQGLMFIDLTRYRGKVESQKNKELVYIDILATAPWNRIGFSEKPKYKGIGRLMLVAAISSSVDAGFKGRVALHSLPQSKSWYQDVCKMTDLGIDGTLDPLHYFEMTEDQATAFIEN